MSEKLALGLRGRNLDALTCIANFSETAHGCNRPRCRLGCGGSSPLSDTHVFSGQMGHDRRGTR